MSLALLGNSSKLPTLQHDVPRSNRKLDQLSLVTRLGSQIVLLIGIVAWSFGYISFSLNLPFHDAIKSNTLTASGNYCHPPLPPILRTRPPSPATDLSFQIAAKVLDKTFSIRASLPDIDSLSVAIVTPSGNVFQRGYGRLKANESQSDPPDGDSLYRIASISKMFASLELMILKQRGILNWDDPVQKFLPNFTYYPHGWSQRLEIDSSVHDFAKTAPITLRQLASHMSGIGRDLPPATIKGWPNIDLKNVTFERPDTTPKSILKSIASLPLISPPYTRPTYSNTGFNVLGQSLVVAANKTNNYAELLHRDVFGPLGLSSSFNISKTNAKRVAIPSTNFEEADMDLGEAYNAAGGQFSSIDDLSLMMRTFLDPSRSGSLLSPYEMREWLRPVYTFSDDVFEVGAPWEIEKLKDSNGVIRKFFSKSGDLTTYHSTFTFDPISSFGVIVLLTGRYGDAIGLAKQAINIFRPAFDRHIEKTATELYAGKWVSEDKKSTATTFVKNGGLWINELILNGTNVFSLFESPTLPSKGRSYAMWSSGEEREDEFRIALLIPSINGNPVMPCTPSWEILDPFYSRGAPVDLVLFEGKGDDRAMVVPSFSRKLRLKRS